MGICYSTTTYTETYTYTVTRTTRTLTEARAPVGLMQMPALVLFRIALSIDGPLFPLLYINRTLMEVAHRILLCRISPRTESQAASIIRLLERVADYSSAVRAITWSNIDLNSGEARASAAQIARIIELSKELRIVTLMIKAGTEDAVVDALNGPVAEAPELQSLRMFGANGEGDRRMGVGAAPIGLLRTQEAGRLRSLSVRGDVADVQSVVMALPAFEQLVELVDWGMDDVLVWALIERAPKLASLELGGGWRPLGRCSDRQLAQLERLRLYDHGGQWLAAVQPPTLAFTFGRLTTLRILSLTGVLLDETLVAALPPSLVSLELVCAPMDAEASRMAPMAPLIADVMAGPALPALRELIAIETIRSVALDDACQRRGIRLCFVSIEQVCLVCRGFADRLRSLR